jgi:hypothetical protein
VKQFPVIVDFCPCVTHHDIVMMSELSEGSGGHESGEFSDKRQSRGRFGDLELGYLPVAAFPDWDRDFVFTVVVGDTH